VEIIHAIYHPGIYTVQLADPLVNLVDAHLLVEVADQQGNLTRVNRRFSVGDGSPSTPTSTPTATGVQTPTPSTTPPPSSTPEPTAPGETPQPANQLYLPVVKG
jgi:hypothetical protein